MSTPTSAVTGCGSYWSAGRGMTLRGTVEMQAPHPLVRGGVEVLPVDAQRQSVDGAELLLAQVGPGQAAVGADLDVACLVAGEVDSIGLGRIVGQSVDSDHMVGNPNPVAVGIA